MNQQNEIETNQQQQHIITEPELDDFQKTQIRSLYQKFQTMNESHRRAVLRIHWDEPPRLTAEEIQALPNPEPHIELPNDDRWGSKLGGYPFWPEDTVKYPYKRSATVSNGEQAEIDPEDDASVMGSLQLLAQFNLQDVANAPGVSRNTLEEALFKLKLPTDGGILQFYIKPDFTFGLYPASGGPGGEYQSAQSFRIRYWPREVVDATTKLLSVDHFPQLYRNVQTTFSGEYSFPFDPSRVLKINYGSKTGEGITEEFWGWNDFQFSEKFNELLRQEAPEIVSHLTAPGGERDQWKIAYALSFIQEEARFIDTASGSKLGGHPTFTQEDPRRSWKAENRDLLFQLDSDSTVMVGDAGVMNFFNASGYSLKGETGEAKYNWDCS